MNLEDFEAWLREQGYAERTVQDTVMSTEGILATVRDGGDVSSGQWTRARRILRYAEARQLALAQDSGLRAAASDEAARATARGARRRKLEARSFDDAAWGRLARAIVADEARESRVLEVMMVSGLRVADVLRTRRMAVFEAFETGRLEIRQKGDRPRVLALGTGALRRAMDRLGAAWAKEDEGPRRNAKDIATWMVPGSTARLPIDSARKSVYRHLHELGEAVDCRGRIHLHRMRRTVAVQALRATGGDVATVGQLLGHKPGSKATWDYIDEARVDDVATVQDAVFDRFVGPGPGPDEES